MTYRVRFLDSARAEFLRLPARIQVQLKEWVPYLEHAPYRPYPFLQVKEVGGVPGVWRFPLGPYRVFFKVEGSLVWIGKFWLRPSAYDSVHIRELRRTFHNLRGSSKS